MCAAMSRACPHCGQTIPAEAVACRHCKKRISAPAEAAQPAASEQPAAPPAAAPQQAAIVGRCPKCGAGIAEDAVLCVQCGHHLKYGVSATTVARAREAGGAATKIGLALAVSGLGCVLGGLVWALIAYFLHVEIGLLAIGIGFLGGLGIVAVTEERSVPLGMAAAGFALLGIVVGKLLIFQFYFAMGGIAAEMAEDPEIGMMAVGLMMMENGEFDPEIAARMEDGSATDEDYEKMEEAVRARHAAMSEEELEAAVKNLTGEITEDVPYWARLWATVSLWDILWCILALSTAFGMASKQQ